MPVLATLKQILELCWRERATALKYGAVPVAVNLILVVFFSEATPTSFAAYARTWTISLISVLAYAPFCVAWYRMIVLGKDAVASRPVFTVTKLELRFFGWMITISIMAGLLSVIVGTVGAGIVIALLLFNTVVAAIVGIVMFVSGLATLLMALSRWSIGLSMVAVGQPMDLQRAWDAAKPYGWRMAGMQIIIFLAAAALAAIPLAAFLPEFMEAIRTKTAAPESVQVAVQLIGTVTGVLILLLTSTMYALVYCQAMPDRAVPPPDAESTAPAPAPQF